MGLPTGLKPEAPVHYFTMGDERWNAYETWPPNNETQAFCMAQHYSL
jgi:uncharacterized protein